MLWVRDGGNEVYNASRSAMIGLSKSARGDKGEVRVGASTLTIDLLLVNVLDRVVIRVARRQGRLEGVVEIIVVGDQIVKEPRAAVVALLDGGYSAAGGEVGGVQDGRVRILLVEIHGGWRRQHVRSGALRISNSGRGPCVRA